jgi:large subunit ribosomal protein L22
MRAYLKYHRQSPRKVRLVADLLKGKSIPQARVLLRSADKRAAPTLLKLLNSAAANAKQNNEISDDGSLVVENISVNDGATLKRHKPRARGAAYTIRKRTSNVSIVLSRHK